MSPQEIDSASYQVRLAAARFVRVVREASRELGFVAESSEHLFDSFRLLAAQALGSPEVNRGTIRSLAPLGDPADILAAIFCAEDYWVAFRDRLDEGSSGRVGALLEAGRVHATLLHEDRSQDFGRITEYSEASYGLLVHLRRAKGLCRQKAERIEQMLSRTGYKADFT